MIFIQSFSTRHFFFCKHVLQSKQKTKKYKINQNRRRNKTKPYVNNVTLGFQKGWCISDDKAYMHRSYDFRGPWKLYFIIFYFEQCT